MTEAVFPSLVSGSFRMLAERVKLASVHGLVGAASRRSVKAAFEPATSTRSGETPLLRLPGRERLPKPRAVRYVLLWLLAVVAAGVGSSAALAAGLKVGDTLEGRIQGSRVDAVVLGCGALQVQLLGRDGRLWLLAPGQADVLEKTYSSFRPYSPSVLRGLLQREIGRDYEVSGAGPFSVTYLMIHPRGQGDKWTERLSSLYRSFVHYFSVRGFTLETPAFPLVGFVCKDRNEFDRLAAKQPGLSAKGGILGYYSNTSNRITLYDMGSRSADWARNASVLIHEATHQTAFNTGIHSRYSPPPSWVAEGLATMFEAPGVYDSHNHPQPSDRVNRGRLQDFRKLVAPRHRPEMIASIVASDAPFGDNPPAAYAEAWALTFYLVETQPRKYAEYLKRTGSHRPFHECTASERTADFTAVFGSDWRMLDARLLRYMAEVR
jgi:hypothetical protein